MSEEGASVPLYGAVARAVAEPKRGHPEARSRGGFKIMVIEGSWAHGSISAGAACARREAERRVAHEQTHEQTHMGKRGTRAYLAVGCQVVQMLKQAEELVRSGFAVWAAEW